MKHWIKWLIIACTVALVVAGVMRSLAARKTQNEALQSQQSGQKVLNPVNLQASETTTAKTLQLSQTLPISGSVRAVHTAVIKARVPGELQGLTVREGDTVKAGQVLARIDDTEFKARVRQANQQAQSAKTQIDIAQRNYDNNRSLVEQGFISKTALDTSSNNLTAAQANFQAAQAALDIANKSLDDALLRSPITGQVAQKLAQVGERVGVDARILEIVDLKQLELEVPLTAADSLRIQTGQTAKLRLEGLNQDFSAKVNRINPSATAGSRAVMAYLSIAPGTGLRQGLFAQGEIFTGEVSGLAVPLSTIRTDKPQPYVQWIKDGKVQHQTVQLGARGHRDNQAFVMVEGINENTIVLMGSVGTLRPDTPVTILNGAQ